MSSPETAIPFRAGGFFNAQAKKEPCKQGSGQGQFRSFCTEWEYRRLKIDRNRELFHFGGLAI